MTFGIYLMLNVVLILFLAMWLRRLIVRRLEPERILGDLGDEIGELITELNQTGDHNVSVLEDRIMQLRDLLADADRQIEELSAQVAHARDHVSSEEPVYTVSFSGTVGGTQESRGQDREDSADSNVDSRPLWHTTPLESELARPESAEAGQPAHSSPARSSSPPTPSAEPQWDVLSPRERVHELHQQGMSSEIIATKTGMAIGEVELIISLGTRRGGG